MIYRLKDKDLQKRLDELTHGEFSKRLSQWKGHGHPILLCSLIFSESEIEKFQEYNPKEWNKFPDVRPPEGVLMRVECGNGKKTCAKFHTFGDGACWCEQNGSALPMAYSNDVKRFRPWE